ncbi:MAG: MmgE/PrpD family protein [Rubrivivax sp.]
MGLTADLGRFVATLDERDLPDGARAVVRRGLADTWGVLCAGRGEPVVGHALSLVSMGAPGEADLLAGRGRAGAPDAALVNATAGHALDYDDTGLDGHPSVVLAPAVLAEAEAQGRSWRALTAAYVAGYETWAELIARDADQHHGKGWHPTAVFGTVAAAAAGAVLHRMDADRAAHALGLAASMAAGLVANFGSMTKPLQVGFAARNGLLAARLAARGATASPDALESPRGFLAALSPAGRVDRSRPVAAGAPWQILQQGLNVKRYPVCYALHRAVDAALTLHPALQGRVDEIEAIEVTLGRLQAAMLRAPRPVTALDAKFSAEFAMACALSRGRLGLAELRDEVVNEPALQALLRRVQVQVDEDTDAEEPLFSPADRLRVRLRDGTTLDAEPVRRALGHASRPIDDAALHAKYRDCGGEDPWWQLLMRADDDATVAAAAPSRPC